MDGRGRLRHRREYGSMTNTMMMDRTGMGMPGMGMPGMGSSPMGGTTAPMMPNMLMVPRCTMKMEKCTGGMKIVCSCDDPMACSMMQNLCMMLQGGMCSLCCMMNGMMVCCCNLTMGMCKCEMTKDGCCLTCTSGDAECCKMIQACCDCMATMMACGCTCCCCMNNTPICCGTTSMAKAGK
jgi:hypothetical protein